MNDVTISGPLNSDSRRQRMRLRNKRWVPCWGRSKREVQRKEEGGHCLGWWMAARLPGCVGTGGARWSERGLYPGAAVHPQSLGIDSLGMRGCRGHT